MCGLLTISVNGLLLMELRWATRKGTGPDYTLAHSWILLMGITCLMHTIILLESHKSSFYKNCLFFICFSSYLFYSTNCYRAYYANQGLSTEDSFFPPLNDLDYDMLYDAEKRFAPQDLSVIHNCSNSSPILDESSELGQVKVF